MGAPVVQVEGLTFRYPASDQILHGINLEINRGDFVGITGPSGAGKTTMCMCLKGLIPHVVGGTMRGRVTVRGAELFLALETEELVGPADFTPYEEEAIAHLDQLLLRKRD